MQKCHKPRWAAMIALPLVLGSATALVACRDSSSPDKSSASRRSTSAEVRKESRLKTEVSWVGETHNKALNDLRAAMRKPGLMTNNICEYVAAFVANAERFPDGKASGKATDRLSIAKAVLKDGKRCKQDPVTAVVRQGDAGTSDIGELSNRIQAEIDLAADRYDLARRLSPFWVTAAGLNESEAAIIGATLATAQSSFEYWEVEIDRANQEFETEYGECARTASSNGYDYDVARQVCLEGDAQPAIGPNYAPSPSRIASLSAKQRCRVGVHFKNLAKADAAGAFGGAVKGAMTAGLPGVVPGAVVGGVAGSATSWFYSAWELYWCAVK